MKLDFGIYSKGRESIPGRVFVVFFIPLPKWIIKYKETVLFPSITKSDKSSEESLSKAYTF